jgi:hypothetical protein
VIEAAWIEFWGPTWGAVTGALLLCTAIVVFYGVAGYAVGRAVRRFLEGSRG